MTATPAATSGESWISRFGWVLAATWLVFLVFPLLGILGADDRAVGAKIASTALIAAFGLVYLDGFRRQHQHRHQPEAVADCGERRTGRFPRGTGHFAVLVMIVVLLGLVAGVGSVGVVPFVVVFAVFHFSWLAAWTAYVVGLVVTAMIPLLAGLFGDLWSLSIVVAGVGAAALLIRVFEGHQFDQAHLRTRLAISDERTRVARDVHDVLGHSLTAVILKVELCERLLAGSGRGDTTDPERIEACRQQLAELDSISRRALSEIRSTVGGLRATDVADEVTAARTVLADAGVDLLVTGDVTDIDDGHRSMLAWVVREAVTNIVRHARAERCHIELAPEQGAVLLRVSDDGVGLGDRSEGNGLRGLRERVASAGGALRIESPAAVDGPSGPAGGTRIEVAV